MLMVEFWAVMPFSKWLSSIRPHGVAIQETTINTFTVMRTSSLKYKWMFESKNCQMYLITS